MSSIETPGRRRGQRGDLLLEALIATAIVIFLGYGLTYGVSKVTVAQRGTNVHTLTIAQLRSKLQTDGFTNGCTVNSTTSSTPSITVATGQTLNSVSKSCTSAASNVTVGTTVKSVQVPHVVFTVTDSTLLGSGNSLVLTN